MDDLIIYSKIESEFYITNTAFILDYQLEFSSISYKLHYYNKAILFIRVQFQLQVERFKNAGPSVHPRDARPAPKHGVMD